MEWVETTGKSLEEAKDRALDQLGVGLDEAEFEVLEEPRTGLFGRVRGEARVRARVKPAVIRPKQERRNRGRSRGRRDERGRGKRAKDGSIDVVDRDDDGDDGDDGDDDDGDDEGADATADDDGTTTAVSEGASGRNRSGGNRSERSSSRSRSRTRSQQTQQQKEHSDMDAERPDPESTVTPQDVGEAAVAFMSGLAGAFGADATATLEVDDAELEVRVEGTNLGLLVGPGGRTLMAVQDLARVASQRRLGDHDTRLRVDVGGYREKRRAALEKFALAVANQVRESGAPKALEPMSSADRKIIHDALLEVDGVVSRSEGDDPTRRVVISPA